MLQIVLELRVMSNSPYLSVQARFRFISRHVTIGAILTANGGKNFTIFEQSFLAEAKIRARIACKETQKYTSEP